VVNTRVLRVSTNSTGCTLFTWSRTAGTWSVCCASYRSTYPLFKQITE